MMKKLTLITFCSLMCLWWTFPQFGLADDSDQIEHGTKTGIPRALAEHDAGAERGNASTLAEHDSGTEKGISRAEAETA